MKKFQFSFPNEPHVLVVIQSPNELGAILKAKVLNQNLGVDLTLVGECK